MTRIPTRRQFMRVSLATLAPLALAACGGAATVTTSNSASAATTSGAATAAATTGAAAAVTASTSTTAPASKAPAANLPQVYIWSNMINHDPASGTAPDKLKQVTQYIADRTNVMPVAYIPPTDNTAATTKLNLLLSGGQPLDIFQGNWDQYQQVGLAIGKMLDASGGSIRSRFSPDLWAKMTDASGQVWGVPRLALQLKSQPTWFRTDWLKELNLPMPATFADLENTLAAFQKKNPNASLATSSINDFRYATVGGFTEFGYSNWLDKSDNKLKPAELQPGYSDWVAKMADWYKKGWLNKGTFANPGIPRDEALAKTGNLGAWAGWYSRVTLYFNPKDAAAVPGMAFDFAAQGIKGTGGFMETYSPGGTGAIMISKLSKNPDAAFHFLNWQYQAIENSMIAEYGIQDTDWKWADSQHLYFDRPTAGTPQAYAGEYMASSGPWSESQVIPNDPLLKEHYLFIHNDIYNYEGAKAQVDVKVPYNSADIKKQVPGLTDLSTLIDQETVKFITGVRDLTEWNGFLGQLQSAGLNDWITAYTAQYMKFQK